MADESEEGDHRLVNKETDSNGEEETRCDDTEILRHKSYEQVMLDVNRCAGRLEHIRQVYYHRTDDDESPFNSTEDLADSSSEDEDTESDHLIESDDSSHNHSKPTDGCHLNKKVFRRKRSIQDLLNQKELKKKLAKLIVTLLMKKSDLHYYQGLHDVCLTYMTLLGPDKAFEKLDDLIDSHFNIFMQPTMSETQDFLSLIPIVVGLKDKKVQDFLDRSEVGTIFALSWVITWFSHVIPDELVVEKLFRFFELRDPHMVLYVCAEIVIYSRNRLLNLEAEMSTVHHFLTQIPRKEKLPWDDLMEAADKTFSRWSPETVKNKLDHHRKTMLQVQDANIIGAVTRNLAPALSSLITSRGRTAIIVLVVASAIALQFDRWIR